MSLPQSLLALLPPPAPAVPGLPTGVEALDAALLGGGFPPGRLTEIAGTRGSGTATLLRQIVESTIARRGWVACIDAARTLAPRDWAHLGAAEGFWMIRPRDPARAAWCADVLLRCGAFTLVVIDSAPRLTRAVAVRLTRLARDSNAALVVVSEEDAGAGRGGGGSMLGGAVRLRLGRGTWEGGHGERSRKLQPLRSPPHAPNTRTLKIVVEKGGSHRTVEVSCAIGVARRLCAHSQVPDRRGVARRSSGGSGGERRAAPAAVRSGDGAGGAWGVGKGGDRVGPAASPNEHHGGTRVLARKRRCAEPDYGTGDASHVLRPASPVALG